MKKWLLTAFVIASGMGQTEVIARNQGASDTCFVALRIDNAREPFVVKNDINGKPSGTLTRDAKGNSTLQTDRSFIKIINESGEVAKEPGRYRIINFDERGVPVYDYVRVNGVLKFAPKEVQTMRGFIYFKTQDASNIPFVLDGDYSTTRRLSIRKVATTTAETKTANTTENTTTPTSENEKSTARTAAVSTPAPSTAENSLKKETGEKALPMEISSQQQQGYSGSSIVLFLLLSAALIGLGYLFYRKRKEEAAIWADPFGGEDVNNSMLSDKEKEQIRQIRTLQYRSQQLIEKDEIQKHKIKHLEETIELLRKEAKLAQQTAEEAQARTTEEIAHAQAQAEREVSEARQKASKDISDAQSKAMQDISDAQAKAEQIANAAQAQAAQEIAAAQEVAASRLASVRQHLEAELDQTNQQLTQAREKAETERQNAAEAKALASKTLQDTEQLIAQYRQEKEQAVTQAQQEKEQAISLAQQEKEEAIASARQQAENRIAQAQAEAQTLIDETNKIKDGLEGNIRQAVESAVTPLQTQIDDLTSTLREKTEALTLALQEKEVAISAAEQAKNSAIALATQEKEEAIATAEQQKAEAIALAQQEKAAAIATAEQEKTAAIAAAQQDKDLAIATAEQQKTEAIAAAARAAKEDIAQIRSLHQEEQMNDCNTFTGILKMLLDRITEQLSYMKEGVESRSLDNNYMNTTMHIARKEADFVLWFDENILDAGEDGPTQIPAVREMIQDQLTAALQNNYSWLTELLRLGAYSAISPAFQQEFRRSGIEIESLQSAVDAARTMLGLMGITPLIPNLFSDSFNAEIHKNNNAPIVNSFYPRGFEERRNENRGIISDVLRIGYEIDGKLMQAPEVFQL